MNSIIIEGADGTGKTTLAISLASHYGYDICHCTAEDPADYEFYKHTGRKQNVIWDRHTIGELIYPTVFGRKAQISPEAARLVLAYAKEAGTATIVLSTDIDIMRQRLLQRGNECKEVLDKLEWINDQFIFYANEFNIPIIDTSKMSFESICNIIEQIWKTPFEFIHK